MPELQRQLNIKPTVSSLGNPVGPDVTTASLLNAASEGVKHVGKEVRSFVLEGKKDDLTAELDELRDDVYAHNTGKDVRRVTDMIRRLKLGSDQGQLSDTMVKIETESILKAAIDKNPAFGDELRQFAAQELSYDPTGSYFRHLTKIPESAKPRVNPELQAIEDETDARMSGLPPGADRAAIRRIVQKGYLASKDADRIRAEETLGDKKLSMLFNAELKKEDAIIADYFNDTIKILQQGGFQKPADARAALERVKATSSARIRASMGAGELTPSTQEWTAGMARLDALYEPLFQLTDVGSMESILETDASALAHEFAIQGAKLMPELVLMENIGGQEGVQWYFTYQKQSKDKSLLAGAVNPEFQAMVSTMEGASEVGNAVLRKVLGKPTVPLDGDGMTQYTPEAEAMFNRMALERGYELVKDHNVPDEIRDEVADGMRLVGGTFAAAGAYVQEGVRGISNSKEVEYMKGDFKANYEPLVGQLATSLSTNPKLNLRIDNTGLLKLDFPEPAAIGAMGGVATRPIDVAYAETLPMVKQVNVFLKGAQTGWERDWGVNKNTFSKDTLHLIEGAIAEAKELDDTNKQRKEAGLPAQENN